MIKPFSFLMLLGLLAACGPKTAPSPEAALALAPGYLATLDDAARAEVTILEERPTGAGVTLLYAWPAGPATTRLAATYVMPVGEAWTPILSAMLITGESDDFGAVYTSEETRDATLVFGRAPAGTTVRIQWQDDRTESVSPAAGMFVTLREAAVAVAQVDWLDEEGTVLTSRFFTVPTIAPSDQG